MTMQGDEIDITDEASLVSAITKLNWKAGGIPQMDTPEAEDLIAKALTAAEARGYARCKEEAARVAVKEIVGGFSISPLTPYGEAVNETANRIAAAIRALKP